MRMQGDPITLNDILRMLELTVTMVQKYERQQEYAHGHAPERWREDNPLRPERREVDRGVLSRLECMPEDDGKQREGDAPEPGKSEEQEDRGANSDGIVPKVLGTSNPGAGEPGLERDDVGRGPDQGGSGDKRQGAWQGQYADGAQRDRGSEFGPP